MIYLVTPETPDHLPLATLPCLPEQCNYCGENFSRKSILSKHVLVVHWASCPSKILQDIYLAKLMAHIRISFVICDITFQTRISFKKHMKRGAHLFAPGPEDVEGGLGGKFCCCWIRSVWGDKAHKRERAHPCNFCDKAFKSLQTPNQDTIWQHSLNVFVCKGCDKKFKTNNSINRHNKQACWLQASPQE